MPDAAPLVVDSANAVGAVGQPCTTGGGCDPGLSCRALDHVCVAPKPDAAPLVVDASNAIGAVGQACTPGGGCDPGLSCRAADRICVVPTPDAAPDVAKCSTGPLGGLGIPAGTVASTSGSYLTNTPEMAIDGVLSTAWNSGGFSGWLQFHFPKPTAITAIRIHASAKPTTNEIYTITTDFQKPIGTATRQVLADTVAGITLDPIPVTPGTYSDITITVNGGASWVQIHELSLINDDCPNTSLTDAGMR
jgi:hypothetical protein